MNTVQQLLARKEQRLITIEADAPVRRAIELLAENHIGALPVMRDGALVGIISERDYARKVVLKGRSSRETAVGEIMSSPVHTVVVGDTVRHCMEQMTAMRIRHLPVIAGSDLLGIISIGDCVRAVIEEYEHEIDALKRYIAS